VLYAAWEKHVLHSRWRGAKRLTTSGELAARKNAWARAHEATPHGEPVLLEAAAARG
jgi:hypothetical protein